MIDSLREIIAYTYKLGFIDTVKITGTESTTSISAVALDNSVVLRGVLNTPVPEFAGTFGLPNLDRLNTILEIPEYDDSPTLTVGTMVREGVTVPANIKFENKNGDFINEYRLMSEELINVKMPAKKFNAPKWDLEFSPSVQSIQRFKYQAQAAGTDENTFTAKTDKGDLKLFIGDASTHSGNFVFEHDVKGQLKTPRNWPLKQVLTILGLTGDKVMKISDAGAMVITVESGMASHDYIIMAFTK